MYIYLTNPFKISVHFHLFEFLSYIKSKIVICNLGNINFNFHEICDFIFKFVITVNRWIDKISIDGMDGWKDGRMDE